MSKILFGQEESQRRQKKIGAGSDFFKNSLAKVMVCATGNTIYDY